MNDCSSTNSFKIKPCAKRWNFPSIDLSTRMVRTCVRDYGPIASCEDIAQLKTEVFLNHPYMQKGRELMIKGEYQEDCKGCYKYLENGFDGFRTPFDQTVKELSASYGESAKSFLKNIESKTIDQKYLFSSTVLEMEVSFGNLCDLMCLYCNANYSSKIEAEEKEAGDYQPAFIRNKIEDNEDFLEAFWLWVEQIAIKDVRTIHLVGGETLFSNYLFEFLKRFDEIYKKQNSSQNILINIFSNLNNEASVNRLIETTSILHPRITINVQFSNESIGKKAEIIRYGLDWNRAVNNIRQILKCPKIRLGFGITINTLSLSGTLEYLNFIKDMRTLSQYNFYISDNYISYPYGQNPCILTENFTRYTVDVIDFLVKEGNNFIIDSSTINKLIMIFHSIDGSIVNNNKLSESNDNFLKLKNDRIDFARGIQKMEKRRGIKFWDIFPEYKEFYELCCQYMEEEGNAPSDASPE